ncbi:response regulator transcription factor [Azohydromonas caseinilytica]|uniref:Response regulator n=1 Tax=Azohydromonas caseinilytica TaxID=2728836 RepID=A0A848FH15_9BURK|nr:DNA-binding response regulator [Azohydromonas caseinilytica]NML18436.1 response regulator [Azohydromonas caseinilytica]
MNNEPPELDRGAGVVLVVDDVPDNLALLHDALDESGYTVLVATSGEQALARAAQADIVLLDAVMPGMDGFEVARRLRADPRTAATPIVFMTGLSESEHLVAAFAAGGNDYVVKPVRTSEVLARMAAHLHSARSQRQARNALDAFGHASVVVRARDGRLVWQTALARRLLAEYFNDAAPPAGPSVAPAPIRHWLQAQPALGATLSVTQGPRRLTFVLHEVAGEGEWLLVLREQSDAAVIAALGPAFGLTARESQVLYWVLQGKTNRDIGDILGTSPRTVTKHLEHVFDKLGVETRTAAAALVVKRLGPMAGAMGG